MKLTKLRVTIGVIIVAIFAVYAGGSVYYQSHFLPRTTVLGTKIENQSSAAAKSLLSGRVKQANFKITENGKTVATATQAAVGIQSDFGQSLKTIMAKQNAWSWPLALFGLNANSIPNSQALINSEQLEAFSAHYVLDHSQARKASTNAELAFKNGKLVATKETYGNQLSVKQLEAAIKASVDKNQNSVNLKAAYIQPTLKENSAKFKSLKTQMHKIAGIHGDIKIYNNKTVNVSTAEATSWVTISNGKVALDQTKVDHFLDGIDNQYSTYGKSRSFQSTARGTVTVSGGLYGWTVNQKAEASELSKDVLAGKDFDSWIETKGSGYSKDGTDIGKTYVEVDVQNQHEYYYKDGALVMDSAVVTGNPTTNHATPTGVYDIWSKQQNAVLKGQNDNGSDYATTVSYWMPIDDTGVGLHDSSWQPTYGGNWYLSHGSHGCVNNPPAFIAKLYAAVSVGTPVIVF